MKTKILTALGVILTVSIIFIFPFIIDTLIDGTHKNEIYKALDILEEYEFDENTEMEFRELIDKVANDPAYTIVINTLPLDNGIEVKVSRGGDYSMISNRYFYGKNKNE